MANTLTNLIPDAFVALDVVSRELTGFINSVARDSTADRLATGQTIRSHVAPVNSAGGDITPAMALATAANQTIANVPITLTKSRFFPFSWSGEEQYAMDQGPGYLNIRQDQIAQAIRACVNEMETDLATAAYLGASRSVSPNDTSAFKTNLADSANVRKILDDNGAPASARSLIINTTAGAALRTQTQLTKVNEAGTQMTLRDGELLNIHGFSVKESAKIQTPTAGSMSGGTSTGALTVGQTVIPLKNATGTGTVAAGDIITIANDTNQYVVASASFAGANPATGDTITLAAPGLLKAQSSADRVITVVASSARNIALSQNALLLATRLPVATPGDLATMREVITDPRTGLSFEIVAWPGADMVTYHVRACWGVKVLKPEHMAILLG